MFPPTDNVNTVANEFCDFFIGKIASTCIRNQLSEGLADNDVLWADVRFSGEPMETLAPVTSDEIFSKYD